MIRQFLPVAISAWLYLALAWGPVSADTLEQDYPLTGVSLDGWEQRLETWKPKIVVVDYWATWCSSCLERFPKMIELQQHFATRNVQFVGLNMDDPNDAGSVDLAKQFLQKVNADFPQYHITDNLKRSFERLALSSIPAVTIYDARGKEVKRLTGDNPNDQFTEDDIKQALLDQLAVSEGEH